MAEGPVFIDLTAEDSMDEPEEFVPPTPASTTVGLDAGLVCGMCGDDMLGGRMATGPCGHVFCAACLSLRAECPTCMARLTYQIQLIFR